MAFPPTKYKGSKKVKNIGIDIGKKTCVVYVVDDFGKILEETKYENIRKDAKKFAMRTKRKYQICIAICG